MRVMKNICLLLMLGLCACGSTNSSSSKSGGGEGADVAVEDNVVEQKQLGTVFFDVTPEEAFEKAKVEGKYVLVDFYTKTCGPCKKMQKVVFPTFKCGDYVNKRFVPIMLDGEDGGIGQELAGRYDIFIFPSYLVLQPNGFREGVIQGAEFDVDNFLDMLKTIIHDK